MDWQTIKQEVTVRTSRSSGAGGQHVNKTETRVEILFDLRNTTALNSREKKNIRYHNKRKIDKNGLVSIIDQSGRSQHTNKTRAMRRLKELVSDGSKPIPKKHVGKAFTASRGKRLDNKKRRAEIKAGRGKIRY